MNPFDEKAEQANEMWARANALSSLPEADRFLQDFALSIRSGSLDVTYARTVLNTAVKELMAGSRDDPEGAEEVISRHILPICLEGPYPIDTTIADPRSFRDYLAAWFEQYPDEKRLPMRQRVLDKVLAALLLPQPEPAIWTIFAIGLRSYAVEKALVHLARRDDAIGDAAINCLAGLSPAEDIAKILVSKVARRLPRRRLDTFSFAIQELASRRFMPAVTRRLLPLQQVRSGDNQDRPWDQMSAIGLLGCIAQREPNNHLLQRRISLAFRRAIHSGGDLRRSVLVAGNGITFCNSAKVTGHLLQLLRMPNADFFLVCKRLADCVLPEQLDGWREVETSQLKTELTAGATISTGGENRSMTIESHVRSLVWDVAFAAGITDVHDWLDNFLQNETNPYGLSEILSFTSFIRMDRVPRRIVSLVQEQVDVKRGGSEPSLGARITAVQVLRASPSEASFEALLDSGLTFQGASLRRVGEAVADVAERLAKQHEQFVLSRLLEISESPFAEHRRSLAVVALQRLASIKALPVDLLPSLIKLARDETLPAYARSYVIWSLGSFPEVDTPVLFECLLAYARDSEADPDVRFQSLDALIRLGKWVDFQSTFLLALSIPSLGQSVPTERLIAYQPWQALILANLFLLQPEVYYAPAVDLISRGPGDVVHIMLQVVGSGSLQPNVRLAALARVAIEHMLKRFGSTFGETDDFEALARISPEEYIATDWESTWNNWMPAVRASLAEAFHGVFPRLSLEQKERVFDLLVALLGDSTYQVRRSAARTFAKVDIDRFARIAHQWARSGSTEVRRRASEMAQWLPPDDEVTLHNQLLNMLSHDPEPSVRKTSTVSCEGLRRRVWRNTFFERILQERSNDGNAWISRAYRYGRALTRIGDDETLAAIRDLGSKEDVPPNVQNWLRSVATDLETQWRDVTRRWPDPWLPWSGRLEEVEGTVKIGEDNFPAHLSLWFQRQADPRETTSWGGAFQAVSDFKAFKYFAMGNEMSVTIGRRRTASAIISTLDLNGRAIFIGTGPYPEVV
jgi:hypothetical protein